MRIHIPLTQYDLNVSKRGISYIKKGQIVGFTEWRGDSVLTRTTPIMEEIFTTVANEFAKIDLKHVVIKENKLVEVANSNLNYLLSERPNPLQTKFDLLFTLAYQRIKHGNALAFLERDKNGNVTAINPINANDYQMGCGYELADGRVFFKFKNIAENKIELVDYRNIIHLRANPNDVFYGDMFSGYSYNKVITKLIDNSLNTLINELEDAGNVRGIIQIGGAATGYARGVATRVMAGQEEKVTKQDEIVERIKKSKGGILVLDAGEEWKPLANPFSTAASGEINKYIDVLLQFNGINKKVVDGTASADAMEVFFYKTISPIIEQFISELNFKVFSKTAISRGNRIEYYRNPFEYISVEKAIDIAYKGAMDTTTNERRRMIYKLPPVKGGDKLMSNKNFENVLKQNVTNDDDDVNDNTNDDENKED